MDNKIEFWDLQKSKLTPVGSVMLNRRVNVNSVSRVESGSDVAVGRGSTAANCDDKEEWERFEEDDCLTVVDWSSDDKFVVCGGLSGKLYVLNMATDGTSSSTNMPLQAVAATFDEHSINSTPVEQLSSQ
ncbi:unnamed protein product [Ambrosiozyma monospora]|uniref:Unnamed protein product n=1 Tax=Ambrosiozyma monospora TaxID=43982 RepID=A0A9W7DH13_AMBMO|nr:unnamed protein product [Ambrosiozyma monospora]